LPIVFENLQNISKLITIILNTFKTIVWKSQRLCGLDMIFFVLLIASVSATEYNKEKVEKTSGQKNTDNIDRIQILVKIEEDEYAKAKKKTSKYIGVLWNGTRWLSYRWNKNKKKIVYNGVYKDEETAAHASDTLARSLMKNGKQILKLNFPDNDSEVYRAPTTKSSRYIGVAYSKINARWIAQRRSNNEKKMLANGTYKDEEKAARASDTLARKLMTYGEHHHTLNFPDDKTEVKRKEVIPASKYIGVTYDKKRARWVAQRRNKNDKSMVYNGSYKDEQIAAYASDTLARNLIENDEQNHRLNFPDDGTEVCTEKRTPTSKYIGVFCCQTKSTCTAYRYT
jgi:hypothetical protein